MARENDATAADRPGTPTADGILEAAARNWRPAPGTIPWWPGSPRVRRRARCSPRSP